MGKRSITEELVAEWLQLHKKGRSLRNIGRNYGVDPRTVKVWIQRVEEKEGKEHWRATSRQVDAKYLSEHYQLLLQVAMAILDALPAHPVFVDNELDVESLLGSSIRAAMRESPEVLKGRGVDTNSIRRKEFRSHQLSRLAQKLHDALLEHEPQLKMAIDAWKKRRSTFKRARLQLAEEAKNLLMNARRMSDQVAEALKLEVVEETLRNKLLGEEPLLSRVDDRGEGQATLIRYNQRITRKILKGSTQEMETARAAYDKVLEQVCHEERIRPVEKAYSSFMGSMEGVQGAVDRLVLIGRPQGQCALCPNRLEGGLGSA